MRVVAILAFALLTLAAVSLVPASTAASIPPPCQYCDPNCPAYDTVGVITLVVRLEGGSDCHQTVVLLGGVACAGLLDGAVHERIGLVDVWSPNCGPDLTTCIQEGTCDPPMGAAAPAAAADPACTIDPCPQLPDSCPQKTEDVRTGAGQEIAAVNADCSVGLETGKGETCVGAWETTTEHDAGPVHWTEHQCGMPGGGPLCCLSSAAAPDTYPPCQYCTLACKPVQVGTDEVLSKVGGLFGFVYGGPRAEAGIQSDCHPYVDESNVHCPNGMQAAHVDEHAGPATVSADTCSTGPICECMPVGAQSTAPSPATLPPCACPAPAPLCQPINRLIAPGDGPVTYRLSDYCHATLILDFTSACGLQGTEWTVVHEGPVEVDYGHCQSPPQQSASAGLADPVPTCVRDCLPGPDQCTLRDATPAAGPSVGPITPIALRQAVWGNDCTIDVDPIGACAPPSDRALDETVYVVHLHLLLCGGDVPQVLA